MLSIFTPVHDRRFLLNAYESLRVQSYTDFEWVICLNGDALRKPFRNPFPDCLLGDSRVRFVDVPASYGGHIGALKRFACDQCRGDAFLELDYDDMLVPGILTQVVSKLKQGAGFVYSDVAVFNDIDESVMGYHKNWGWEHYDVTVYGKKFIATRNFPITARSLCEVYFAPDHVRVWSRQAYYDAGGHDPQLSVGDDHDLICRTYLKGVPFASTDTCGYLYRQHDSNTVKQRNAAIQQQQAANRQKYLLPLIGEWCKRENKPVVDLLKEYKEGHLRPADPDNLFSVLSARGGWPGHFGQILASDILQLYAPDQVIPFINTCYKFLAHGGWLNITVPHERGRYASMVPTHLTRFNENSFLIYARSEFAKNVRGIDCRFDLVECSTFYPSSTFQQYDMQVLRADLCALSPGSTHRHPGPKLI